MSLKKLFVVGMVLFALTLALLPTASLALTANTGPYLGLEYGAATGLSSQDIRTSVARIIYTVLGLLGTISVALITYAGFKWMTSGGNEEGIKSAQQILIAAVIGLAIILSAYAITRFVMTSLFKATTGVDYTTMGDNG